MDDLDALRWDPLCDISNTDDRNKLMVKLWEYFSTAAAGICQLYRGKVDRCADFRCLIDALQPMDQFFKGSQQLMELASKDGRFMGARCLRLRLRDLIHAFAETNTSEHGVEVVVPLQLLLTHGLNLATDSSARRSALGKRRRRRRGCCASRSCSGSCCGSIGRAAKRVHTRSMFDQPGLQSLLPSRLSPKTRYVVSAPNPDFPGSAPIAALQQPLTFRNSDVHSSDVKRLPPLRLIRSRRRCWASSNQQGSDLPRECLISCQADRYRASLGDDQFNLFQDAAHMANLLDPLSKVSVTSQPDQTDNFCPKRSRLECPIEPNTDPSFAPAPCTLTSSAVFHPTNTAKMP